jgi:hypothetical protein
MKIMGSMITNDGTITLVVDGSSYSIQRSHPAYARAFKAYKEKDAKTFVSCLDGEKAIANYVSGQTAGNGKVEVRNGQVYFNGEQVHNCISERILTMMREGIDFAPMVKFLENLMSNPSFNSRKQLYDFLSHKNLPITDDGCFLAYKTIRSDWYDKYSGTIKNSLGSTIKIDRALVDDNSASHCSHGLHVGALSYAGPGGWYNSGCDRVIIVKVNPRDAVAVPGDHSFTKLRVCEYSVVCEYKAPLNRSAYSMSGDRDIYDNNEAWEDDFSSVSDEELFADDDFEPEYDVDDVMVGQNIQFTYRDADGEWSNRDIYVESIGPDYIIGELREDDPSYDGEDNLLYRRFVKSRMSEIDIEDLGSM